MPAVHQLLIRMVHLILPPPKLLDQVRTTVRLKHFSFRTEQAYVSWIKRFIFFHNKRHPSEMGESEIREYLSHLAIKRRVAASTQTVALSALLFLYREVLKQDLPYISEIERAKQPRRLPVVFTRYEVQAILARLSGSYHSLACLLYGSGLRLMEAVTLRVKDVDFESNQVTIRGGKGATDRVTMLPQSLVQPLREHLLRVKLLHSEDLKQGFGAVYLPQAIGRKYPNACRQWGWQYVFPSMKRSVDPRSGALRRHHVPEDSLQRAVKNAVRQAGIVKHGGCHTLRHSFATHLLEDGYDIHPREINHVEILLRLCLAVTKRQTVLCWIHKESEGQIRIS